MHGLFYLRCGAALLLLAVLSACGESSARDQTTDVTAAVESDSVTSPFDQSKGLHRVMPQVVKMLGDTLGVVMYESVMEPGDSAVWHEHPYHTVYVLEGGTLTVYFEDMEPQLFELPQGAALIQPPLGDAAVNTGETTVRLLTHELYSLDP